MIRRYAAVLLSLLATNAVAQTPGGAGIVYGENHAFAITAPDGWVLETSPERNNGLCAVVYPAGSSWAASKVVMYANTAAKGEGQRTVQELIAFDIEQFRAKAQDLRVLPLSGIKTDDGEAVVQKFTGDHFGNSEAVAYLDSPNVIVMLVLTSRDEAGFLAAYPAFTKLVASYKYLTSDVRIQR